MSRRLYRFRSIDALLGERAELANQEIYFASPHELNDPMEGFMDIFWRGDLVVWRSLLRQYALALTQTMVVASLMGAEFTADRCESVVYMTEEDLPPAPIREKYRLICAEILEIPEVDFLVQTLAGTSAKVSAAELSFYLRALTPSFIQVLAKHVFGSMPNGHFFGSNLEAVDAKGHLLGLLKKTVEQRVQLTVPADIVFSANLFAVQQLQLAADYGKTPDPLERTWNFVTNEFVEFYIRRLERLVYPEWRAACFVEDPNNASMWGAYGDGHAGMCLIFNGEENAAGSAALKIRRIVGQSGGRDSETRDIYKYAPLTFEAVNYTDDFVEIDFFENLGAVPMGKLSGFWFRDLDGSRSAHKIHDTDDFRKGYWETFKRLSTAKTPDWKHEREHRLVLNSMFEQPKCLKYEFKDLAGIVFGAKTSAHDKMAVMKIIDEKCTAEKRTDFEFHQAHYRPRAKAMVTEPLSLLRFQAEEPPAPSQA